MTLQLMRVSRPATAVMFLIARMLGGPVELEEEGEKKEEERQGELSAGLARYCPGALFSVVCALKTLRNGADVMGIGALEREGGILARLKAEAGAGEARSLLRTQIVAKLPVSDTPGVRVPSCGGPGPTTELQPCPAGPGFRRTKCLLAG